MGSELDASVEDLGECELCIVGAGYAALNGLNAAAKYLKAGDRVVVLDKQTSWGGQWTGQYDFVRLHQPYRMFTAGDQPWKLARDPSYLATRREILDHFESVPGISAKHLALEPLFGHAYRGHRIRRGRVEVEAQRLGDGVTRTLRARRLLKATGFDIEVLRPLALSSSRVRSVAVADPILTSPEFLASTAPVYIVGSGKTAMDAARHVLTSSVPRPLHMIVGSGMWFFIRDNLYPRGAVRHVRGRLAGDLFREIAVRFDGSNEATLFQWLEREGIAMNVFGEAGNCRLGMLSYAEREQVARGTHQVHRGHLVDVDNQRMTLREGTRLRDVSVADGAWFINCTTHFRTLPHEPVLQDSGLVCAPQGGLGFSGNTAYFLTHLWYGDRLAEVAPELFRCRVDVEPKLRLMPHISLMTMANVALVMPRLPPSVPSGYRGDFNKWYPLYRQLLTLARMRSNRDALLRKADRLLRTRFSDSPDLPAERPAELQAEAVSGTLHPRQGLLQGQP